MGSELPKGTNKTYTALAHFFAYELTDKRGSLLNYTASLWVIISVFLLLVPSTRIRVRLKRNFFVADTASGNTYPIKTVTANAFFEPLSERNLLETPFSCFRVDGGETELFENDDISELDKAHSRERKWREIVILRLFFA